MRDGLLPTHLPTHCTTLRDLVVVRPSRAGSPTPPTSHITVLMADPIPRAAAAGLFFAADRSDSDRAVHPRARCLCDDRHTTRQGQLDKLVFTSLLTSRAFDFPHTRLVALDRTLRLRTPQPRYTAVIFQLRFTVREDSTIRTIVVCRTTSIRAVLPYSTSMDHGSMVLYMDGHGY